MNAIMVGPQIPDCNNLYAASDELKNNTEWNVQPVLDKSFEDRLYACVLNISKVHIHLLSEHG